MCRIGRVLDARRRPRHWRRLGAGRRRNRRCHGRRTQRCRPDDGLRQRSRARCPEELAAIPYASHYNPHGLSVGDVDGNGSQDVVIADYNNGIVILPGTPPPTADRAVALVPSAATVKQRKPFAFDLKVSNLGPSTTNATATLTLSGAFTGLAAAAGCSVSGATVTCTYASLASGATVTARVTATAGARGKIAATAAVAGSVTDPNAANDTAAATVTVK